MSNFWIVLFLCSLLHVLSVTAAAKANQREWVSSLLCDASLTCSRGGSAASSNEDDKIESIRYQFNRDGYAVLKDFFGSSNDDDNEQTASLVPLLGEDWYGFSTQYWNRIFQVLHEKGHISEPNHVMNQEYVMGKLRQPGFKEIVHRNPGRYEISLNDDDQNADIKAGRSLLYHDMPSLQPIIDKLEPVILSILRQHPHYKEEENGSKKYNLLHSMLISAPGSQTQQFHWDTKHTNEDEHSPAHIINVFIPLLNITTKDLGPTELIPQSHKETRFLYDPKKRSQAKPLRPAVTPLMNVGDALVFDFRILHRGLANTDLRNLNRPLLVLAFSIPSFHDTVNWPGPSIFE